MSPSRTNSTFIVRSLAIKLNTRISSDGATVLVVLNGTVEKTLIGIRLGGILAVMCMCLCLLMALEVL